MYKTILITWLTNWDDNWIVQETEININVFSLNISGRLMTVVKFSVLTGNKYCIRVSHNWLQLPTSTLHRSPVMPYPHRPRWQTRCRGTVWYHRECWCRWLLACKMARKTCVPCVISASESHFCWTDFYWASAQWHVILYIQLYFTNLVVTDRK